MGGLSALVGPTSPSGGLVAGGVIGRVPSFEEVSTNKLLQSSVLDNASWVKTNVTVAANSTSAPNGLVEADTLTDNSAVATGTVVQAAAIANDSSSWVFSAYFKSGTSTRSKISLALSGGTAVAATVDFNPVSGTVIAQSGVIGPVIEGLTIAGVVWFRVSVAVANNTSGNVLATCTITPDNSSVAGVGSVIAWGTQLENYAVATSPIPTTTVAVTRPAGFIPAWQLNVPSFGNVAVIDQSTYLPVLTNTTNVAASTAYTLQYMRVGNVVNVSGMVDIDPTLAAPTYTELGISFPIASAIAFAYQGGGAGGDLSAADETFAFSPDVANDRMRMCGMAKNAANHTIAFSFQYLVV